MPAQQRQKAHAEAQEKTCHSTPSNGLLSLFLFSFCSFTTSRNSTFHFESLIHLEKYVQAGDDFISKEEVNFSISFHKSNYCFVLRPFLT